MKLSEFKQKIDLYAESIKPHNDPEVVVDYKPPFTTVGGLPCTSVTGVFKGFDWDNGKFFICTEKRLTLADNEFAEQFKKLQADYGWVKLENRNLKAEIKKLNKQIDDLKIT